MATRTPRPAYRCQWGSVWLLRFPCGGRLSKPTNQAPGHFDICGGRLRKPYMGSTARRTGHIIRVTPVWCLERSNTWLPLRTITAAQLLKTAPNQRPEGNDKQRRGHSDQRQQDLLVAIPEVFTHDFKLRQADFFFSDHLSC